MGEGDAAVLRASVDSAERFEVLFDRHHRRMWAYLARLGGTACADDLASEVFVVAFRRRASYEPERGSVQSWLYGIATNLARTRARQRGRGEAALARLQAMPSSEVAVEDRVVATDLARRTLEALDRLSADHREVLVLSVWEGLEYEAIAEVLGVEVGTVRSRLSRARSHLRELAGVTGEVLADARSARRPPHG